MPKVSFGQAIAIGIGTGFLGALAYASLPYLQPSRTQY
jgi:hypothetical protein